MWRTGRDGIKSRSEEEDVKLLLLEDLSKKFAAGYRRANEYPRLMLTIIGERFSPALGVSNFSCLPVY